MDKRNQDTIKRSTSDRTPSQENKQIKLPPLKKGHRSTQSEPNLTALNKNIRQLKDITNSPQPSKKKPRLERIDLPSVKQTIDQIERFKALAETKISPSNSHIRDINNHVQERVKKALKVILTIRSLAKQFIIKLPKKYKNHALAQGLNHAFFLVHQLTLLAFDSELEALESLQLSQKTQQKIDQLLQALKHYSQQSNHSQNARKKIQALVPLSLESIHAAYLKLKDIPNKAVIGMTLHRSQHIIRSAIKLKHLENNPENIARDEHLALIATIEEEMNEIKPYTSIDHQEKLRFQMQEIDKTKELHQVTSRLEKTHEAALNPKTLLRQFSTTTNDDLKLALCLEIAENKSHIILYKILTHLRSELTDILPESQKKDISEQINVAKLTGLIAQRNPEALDLTKNLFTYIFTQLQQHSAANSITNFTNKAQQLIGNSIDIKLLPATLPELISLALNTINHIEKERLNNALERIPETIRGDMLNLEKKIFYKKIEDHAITLDKTQQWIKTWFNCNDSTHLNDLEKFSAQAYIYIFHRGIYQIIIEDNINRNSLADTLYLDYRRLKNMQETRLQLIKRLTAYQTIRAYIPLNTWKQNPQLDIDIQEIIIASSAQAPLSIESFTQALLVWFKQKDIGHIVSLEQLEQHIIPLIHKHCNNEHTISLLMNKRVNHLIKNKIHSACLDMSVIKIPGIKLLTQDFEQYFDSSLTVLINNHLRIHKEYYQKEIHQCQVDQFADRICHETHLPEATLPPQIGFESHFHKLSLRLNNIALLATCMSLTIQFINHLKTPTKSQITDQDIADHIKKTRADILFKRENYSRKQIIEHIKEYNQLPLLKNIPVNLHKIFTLIKHDSLMQKIKDTPSQKILESYILLLPHLFNHYNIRIETDQKKLLSHKIKRLSALRSPGFTLYQSALRDMLRQFIIQRRHVVHHNKKWAALSFFQNHIKEITHDALTLWKSIQQEAKQKTQPLPSLSIPHKIQSGLR
jgi:hypothetical protein